MGTWGEKNFQNDDALDFLRQLKTGADIEKITNILKKVSQYPLSEYLETPDCQMALACAELVASAKWNTFGNLPPDGQKWVKKYRSKIIGNEILNMALSTVKRIKSNSEIKDLWEESSEYKKWLKIMDELEFRLE